MRGNANGIFGSESGGTSFAKRNTLMQPQKQKGQQLRQRHHRQKRHHQQTTTTTSMFSASVLCRARRPTQLLQPTKGLALLQWAGQRVRTHYSSRVPKRLRKLTQVSWKPRPPSAESRFRRRLGVLNLRRLGVLNLRRLLLQVQSRLRKSPRRQGRRSTRRYRLGGNFNQM